MRPSRWKTMDVLSMGPALLYSALFVLYGAMEVLGIMPQEAKSAGLTLSSLVTALCAGQQSIDFIGYHIRRTTATLLVHCSLPLLYCLGLLVAAPTVAPADIWLLWLLSAVIMLLAVGVALYWSHDHWRKHPLVKTLSCFDKPWREVGRHVNLEFRDIDKFVSELGGSTLLVTDSWVIQCNVHTVNLIQQRDAVLNVSSADEHMLSMEGQSVQYLTIRVNSINAKFKSFTVRLNSMQYGQLRERLQSPVRVARSVVIQQSIGDRFAAVFKDQVDSNGTYQLPPGSPPLEPCIGCMALMPQVKLQKRCTSAEEGRCKQCFCRPMWCLSCMCKWFAARQDPHHLDTWMSSTAPCPMCRSTFCMLDIQRLSGAPR